MADFLQITVLPLALTLCAYQLGLLLQKKFRSPLLNPILISVAIVLGFLALTGMDTATYQSGMQAISWLLTPATICLAIPLYQQFSLLKKELPGILAGIAAGTVASLAFVAGWCLVFRYDRALLVSLLPKSVTSAIGVPLAQMGGGLSPITTTAIILTGILGSLLGPLFCKLFRIKTEIAQGVAYGTSAHVIGTAKAGEHSSLAGAVSSLSLVIAGLMTAVLFPLLLQIL
ncbi:MAG: LrgB family protein [Ruminococcaceae bacterium]|nr:LrgB family protein [Oscillospiraceae bacterium]